MPIIWSNTPEASPIKGFLPFFLYTSIGILLAFFASLLACSQNSLILNPLVSEKCCQNDVPGYPVLHSILKTFVKNLALDVRALISPDNPAFSSCIVQSEPLPGVLQNWYGFSFPVSHFDKYLLISRSNEI